MKTTFDGLHEEVFVPVESRDEARGVHRVNDQVSRRAKETRLRTILDRGVVDEVDMPDVAGAILDQKRKMESEAISRYVRATYYSTMEVYASNVGSVTGAFAKTWRGPTMFAVHNYWPGQEEE